MSTLSADAIGFPVAIPSIFTGSQRKLYGERGAAVNIVFRAYQAAMRGDDAVADTQSQSGAFSHRLGGKKRIEYLVDMVIRYTGTVISYLYRCPAIACA